MMRDGDRARMFQYAVVLPLLAIAACAASEARDEPGGEQPDIIPGSDAGSESLDAEADAVAAFVPCVEDGLCPVPTTLTIGSVAAIRGRSKSDVWASASNGVLMRWDGHQWTNIDSPVTHTLSSFSLTSNELWGVAGTVVLQRGIDTNSVRTVDTTWGSWRPFTDIMVLAERDIYVTAMRYIRAPQVSTQLAKFDFDAKTLTYCPSPIHPSTNEPQLLGDTRAAYLVPEKAIWVVGDKGAVARYPLSTSDGGPIVGQGVVVPLAAHGDLFAAWGQEHQLWAAGAIGTILHYDGSRWRMEDTGTTSTLRAIFGFDANDIWAAGDDGTLLHFDGDVWSRMDVGTYRGSLRTIWGAAADDVWIGGERMMLHWGALP